MKEGASKMESGGFVDFTRYNLSLPCRQVGSDRIVVTERGSAFYFTQNKRGIPELASSEHYGTRRQRRPSPEARRTAQIAFDVINELRRPPEPLPPKQFELRI